MTQLIAEKFSERKENKLKVMQVTFAKMLKMQKEYLRKYNDTAANMGFARCGVEGNLREILENTRKKLFHFLVFS